MYSLLRQCFSVVAMVQCIFILNSLIVTTESFLWSTFLIQQGREAGGNVPVKAHLLEAVLLCERQIGIITVVF